MAGIVSLPEEIAISITASNRIADLAQLIEELICNSIDAKSTQIDIFVNVDLMRVEVSDNGAGFHTEVLQKVGTHQFPSSTVSENALYAKLGSSLYWISYLGHLQVISRCLPDYSMRGCAAFRGTNLALGPQEMQSVSKGSKVVVSALFDHLPVRRMALSHGREMIKIAKRVTDIALIHPQTAISVTDSSSNRIVVRIPRVRTVTIVFMAISLMLRFFCSLRLARLCWGSGRTHERISTWLICGLRRIWPSDNLDLLIQQFVGENRRFEAAGDDLYPSQPVVVTFTLDDARFFDCDSDVNGKPHSWPQMTREVDRIWRQLRTAQGACLSPSFLLLFRSDTSSLFSDNHNHDTLHHRSSFGADEIHYLDISPWVPHLEKSMKNVSFPQEHKEIIAWTASHPPSLRSKNTTATIQRQHSDRREFQNTSDEIVSFKGPHPMLDFSARLSAWNQTLKLAEPGIANGGPSDEILPSGCSIASILDWSRIKVIGQLDKKFIVASIGSRLFAFDQHAAHERIRLETLMTECFNTKTGFSSSTNKIVLNKKHIQSVALTHPVLHVLGNEDVEHIMAVSSVLNEIGWRINRTASGIQVLATPAVHGVRLDASAMNIQTAAAEVQKSGCSLILPSMIRDVLASKACRGAIMFGQDLSSDECRVMIAQLSRCSNPFECAHGRPTVCLLKELR